MAVADPVELDLAAIRLRLRRRAQRKVTRAERIQTLRLCKLSNEQIRLEMGLSVDQFRRAASWLDDAAVESRMSPAGVLPLHTALEEYAARHVRGVVRVGLLRQGGNDRLAIQERLGITRRQFDEALTWWRDAMVDSGGM